MVWTTAKRIGPAVLGLTCCACQTSAPAPSAGPNPPVETSRRRSRADTGRPEPAPLPSARTNPTAEPAATSPPPAASASTSERSPSARAAEDERQPVVPCPRFPPRGVADWRPLPELRGKAEHLLTRCYGKPVERSATRQRFVMPRSCSYEKSELVVTLHDGHVVSAKYRTFITGEHCTMDF